MWLRVSDRKLINIKYASVFEIHELSDNLAEVIAYFPDGLNFAITDMKPYAWCKDYIDEIFVLEKDDNTFVDLRK
jgi:hypothetical protein